MAPTQPTSNARFLLKYLLHHKKSYGLGIVFIFITNWLAVNIPVHIGASIDLLSGELEKNQQQLVYNIAIVIGFALIMIVTRTVSRMYFFNPGRAIERELKNDAFAKLTLLQRTFYNKHETGKLISIVNNDINGVRALAEVGRVIIVGRGGVFITRDLPGGIHVRLVAPREWRVRRGRVAIPWAST